jgi:hypothetical protein
MRVVWASIGPRARTLRADVADGAFTSWLHCDEHCEIDKKPCDQTIKTARILKGSKFHQKLSTRISRHPL